MANGELGLDACNLLWWTYILIQEEERQGQTSHFTCQGWSGGTILGGSPLGGRPPITKLSSQAPGLSLFRQLWKLCRLLVARCVIHRWMNERMDGWMQAMMDVDGIERDNLWRSRLVSANGRSWTNGRKWHTGALLNNLLTQAISAQKTATAVAHCKRGRGLIRVNGSPLELLEPEILKFKVYEVILLLGEERFSNVDIRLRVSGGGEYTGRIRYLEWYRESTMYTRFQVKSPRSTLSARLLPRLSSLSTKSTLTKPPRRRSRRPLSNTTVLSLSPIPVAANPRRSVTMIATSRECNTHTYLSLQFGGPGARARYQKSYR